MKYVTILCGAFLYVFEVATDTTVTIGEEVTFIRLLIMDSISVKYLGAQSVTVPQGTMRTSTTEEIELFNAVNALEPYSACYPGVTGLETTAEQYNAFSELHALSLAYAAHPTATDISIVKA